MRLFKRLCSCTGAAPMKTLMILMVLAVIVGFMYQVFVIYSLANTVSASVQQSIMSVASYNFPSLFDSMKEGSAAVEDLSVLVTSEELEKLLTEELGLVYSGNSLVKRGSSGSWYYRIFDINVSAANVASGSGTVRYYADFTLEIPVAEFWDFGSFDIPMHVEAAYTQKY